MNKELNIWSSIGTIVTTILLVAGYFGYKDINSFSLDDIIPLLLIAFTSASILLFLKERQRRKLDQSTIRKLRNKEYTSSSHGFLGSYSEKKVLDYLEKEDINEIWLSGAALYNCLTNILFILNDKEIVFSKDKSSFRIKLIITDINSRNAKEIASKRLPKTNPDPKLKRTNSNLQLAYGNIITLIEKLEKQFEKVEYEIFLRTEHIEERIWMMNPSNEADITFIKEYPYQNEGGFDGIYEGGFQFVLENDYKKEGFKFYHDKFNIYRHESRKVDLKELKHLTNDKLNEQTEQ